jgi:hypothetical protein
MFNRLILSRLNQERSSFLLDLKLILVSFSITGHGESQNHNRRL